MRNRTYGGVRGRKTKVGEKLLRFPPTRFFAAVLNDIYLKEQDMIDGAWNHHTSLVLRNELLES